ncbi:hypothetical protein GH5_02728 [Leishmania sp. Ghana 2012 LV757]|uniref:hypothetical protein n=1 Tax=Leishmania sp. Ghana 2012 LV757 TaxID=2803181 RepID=UPI001B680BEC|nr:hypothetical protein GH5_02728 [Leishmania sp. Ghana 2012 LV757]
MKTLDQWLEDSSSEDDVDQVQLAVSGDGDPASTSGGGRSTASRVISASRSSGGVASVAGSPVSAHTPTALRPANHTPGSLYRRQEETRDKMMRLLGGDAVAKALSPTTSIASSRSPAWPVAAAPDRSHFPFGGTPASAHPTPQASLMSAALTPSLKAVAQTDTATESSQPPEIEKTLQGFNGDSAYEAVEVMVVDRGTQTVSTVGTQTDPLTMPYVAYYPGPFAPSPCTGAGLYRRWMPPSLPLPSYGVGVDNQPLRQCYDDYEQREAAEAAKLRGELEMIQNSIDMLIARYNLPPPPM